ncbi:MAG: hypothetical protein ABIY50_10855 [Ignavibacteria bacterium]
MIPELRNLSEIETNLLLNTPALVTLLIAGAEGNIEAKELDWGAKITHFRGEDRQSILQNYYKEVDANFNDILKQLISAMPQEVNERTTAINNELQKINEIYPKLEQDLSRELHKSYKSLAKHVAQASGGIWGYGSISPQEQKLIDLEVIKDPEII